MRRDIRQASKGAREQVTNWVQDKIKKAQNPGIDEDRKRIKQLREQKRQKEKDRYGL